MKRCIRDISTKTLRHMLELGTEEFDKATIEAELQRREIVAASEKNRDLEVKGPLFGLREEV